MTLPAPPSNVMTCSTLARDAASVHVSRQRRQVIRFVRLNPRAAPRGRFRRQRARGRYDCAEARNRQHRDRVFRGVRAENGADVPLAEPEPRETRRGAIYEVRQFGVRDRRPVMLWTRAARFPLAAARARTNSASGVAGISTAGCRLR